MTALICGTVAAAIALSAGAPAPQTKTITGEQKTVSATVEAIDASRRSVTVKKADGTYDAFYVPSEIKRFDTLKVGDTVKAHYYENVVLTLKKPGEAATDTSHEAVTRASAGKAGTAAHQRVITATITQIDMKAPSITFTGPNNWKYSTRVEDKAALAKVKVGDKVDITWTEAMILSLDEGK
jgi:NADH dehydrogenase FAD-containing subunit